MEHHSEERRRGQSNLKSHCDSRSLKRSGKSRHFWVLTNGSGGLSALRARGHRSAVSAGKARDDRYNSVLSGDSRLLSGLVIAFGGFMPAHFALTRSSSSAYGMAIFRAAEIAFSQALSSLKR